MSPACPDVRTCREIALAEGALIRAGTVNPSLGVVPAEAPPDGVPRGAHSASALVLVADVMSEHPHAVALHAAGVGAIAALLGARRALNGAPDYAQCADAEMRSWASRGALARALHAASAGFY